MASREARQMEWQQERAMARDLESLRRLGPEFWPEESEVEEQDEHALWLDEEDARLEDLAESLRFVVVCDGPELDQPVFVERRL